MIPSLSSFSLTDEFQEGDSRSTSPLAPTPTYRFARLQKFQPSKNTREARAGQEIQQILWKGFSVKASPAAPVKSNFAFPPVGCAAGDCFDDFQLWNESDEDTEENCELPANDVPRSPNSSPHADGFSPLHRGTAPRPIPNSRSYTKGSWAHDLGEAAATSPLSADLLVTPPSRTCNPWGALANSPSMKCGSELGLLHLSPCF
eukprot:TRINITY_DN1182_c0_g1_i1.p1 TRINITY_DN1182_c0_g1~~TRINITY_DN1182_c0_g1_i1.p1  ORF type:complete len:203 (+),score=10.77 TRINITY_DN1182_c0_g1_i1:30-638(+)